MYLLGASGHAKVIIDILNLNQVRVDGLFDADQSIKSIGNLTVVSDKQITANHELIIAIGNNKIRAELSDKYKLNKFFKAIHPRCVISNNVQIGLGTVIMASATVNTDTKIGEHVIINTSASVDHDCIIKDYVHVAPNATLTGGVGIGRGTLVGAGAIILPGVQIGEWCTIGAGAVVRENIPSKSTVVGNPGRIIHA